MSENKFEFHFHGNVGQNIANVENMEVHIDKDANIQVANIENASQKDVKGAESGAEGMKDKRILAIKAVYNTRNYEKSDWAAIVKIMEELKLVPKFAYTTDADLINNACGCNNVTSADSIARSIFMSKVKGVYPNWEIREDEETRETPNKLKTYMEMGRIFIEVFNA